MSAWKPGVPVYRFPDNDEEQVVRPIFQLLDDHPGPTCLWGDCRAPDATRWPVPFRRDDLEMEEQ